MGYPMTYRRVINRNHLAEGGYDVARGGEPHREFRIVPDAQERLEVWQTLARSAYDELNRMIDQRNFLIGDLRRLEEDARDEQAIASYIAQRTGVDVDTVAAVLKEFIDW